MAAKIELTNVKAFGEFYTLLRRSVIHKKLIYAIKKTDKIISTWFDDLAEANRIENANIIYIYDGKYYVTNDEFSEKNFINYVTKGHVKCHQNKNHEGHVVLVSTDANICPSCFEALCDECYRSGETDEYNNVECVNVHGKKKCGEIYRRGKGCDMGILEIMFEIYSLC
jgi:hypothetical protein